MREKSFWRQQPQGKRKGRAWPKKKEGISLWNVDNTDVFDVVIFIVWIRKIWKSV